LRLLRLPVAAFGVRRAIFKRIKGVISVTPGYSGGSLENPIYEQVCTGATRHTEAIQIEFDPKVIELETLLEVFSKLHDPTTVNRQGADVGTEYRSAIFYRNHDQKRLSEEVKKIIDKSGLYGSKVVTVIVPFKNFYKAESSHMNYHDNNRSAPYCQAVIDPKIKKLFSDFSAIVTES